MELSADYLVITILTILVIFGSIVLLVNIINYFSELDVPSAILIILAIIIFAGNMNYMLIKIGMGQS